ncbi:unnamed protein product [Urochloa decumbens]|uniref:non-specific serine/threonine protein kinase n=1 Tax=Urochloa decumbens TaxID=240449 RepID=A0ABC9EDT3_9POAL
MGNCCFGSDEVGPVKAMAQAHPQVAMAKRVMSAGSSNKNNASAAVTVSPAAAAAGQMPGGPRSGGRSPATTSTSSSTSGAAGGGGRILEVANLRVFTFAELRAATRNFKADTVVGEGGFGRVYKGWVDERTMSPGPGPARNTMPVAVKKLNPESLQGLREWQTEVNFLGRLSHPNLVRLLGYCWEEKELLLVYEYMGKGSLEKHLFRSEPSSRSKSQALPWSLRLRIAMGAARGLAFLHSSEKHVIYRDFKASNILLDELFHAKLSDFGLAKDGPAGGSSHVTTRVMGTYGYAAPEYVATGHLYVKSDVYGFGVVLVEILTGLRALDTDRPAAQHSLVDWAKPFLADRKKLPRLIDPRLEGQYPSRAAQRAAQLALRCLAADHSNRPSMREVVAVLEDIDSMSSFTRRPLDGSASPRPPAARSSIDWAGPRVS